MSHSENALATASFRLSGLIFRKAGRVAQAAVWGCARNLLVLFGLPTYLAQYLLASNDQIGCRLFGGERPVKNRQIEREAMKKSWVGLAVVGLVALGVPAHVSLVVKGTVEHLGGQRNLIYDTDLDITWLDYSSGGFLYTLDVARTWAADLSFTINGVTYDNWRLPTAGTNPTFGYNVTTSELGHLFYVELGNHVLYGPDGSIQPYGALINTGDFVSLENRLYLSGTEGFLAQGAGDDHAGVIGFQMGDGSQDMYSKTNNGGLILLVHPGLVQAAPVPASASMLLIGSGLAALAGLRRKK